MSLWRSSLRFLTAGESHGRALVGILEGLPAGLRLGARDVERDLKRRKLGFGRGARQKIEDDKVEILSGVRHGYTLGSPIALLIENKDFKNWESAMAVGPKRTDARKGAADKVEVPRPGHADYPGAVKYGHKDLRNVMERASARETAMRVAIGSVARIFLGELGVEIGSRVVEIGGVRDYSPLNIPIKQLNVHVDQSAVRCNSEEAGKLMVMEIASAAKAGDTLGGVFEVYVWGAPVGLGSYVQWDRRLEAQIGSAFLSLNAIKGVEIGIGFEGARLLGSQVHDEFSGRRLTTNRAGGTLGGVTTGQDIVVRAAMKPLSTLMKPLKSVNMATGKKALAHVERSDVCAVPAAAVIGESLLALVLASAMLEKFGGDSMGEIAERVRRWRSVNSGG